VEDIWASMVRELPYVRVAMVHDRNNIFDAAQTFKVEMDVEIGMDIELATHH